MSQFEREEMIEDIVDLKELGSQEKSAVSFDDYFKKRKCKEFQRLDQKAFNRKGKRDDKK